ncbi:anti-sigma-F factor Fin family protein [Metabacillus sp. GX 13764]|uniref:anti-sigma-F factor Fin family protein n=1 Tax=Metabacillus kandeliae TaxID=2900151 RepID=UPI001E4A87F2|nr:anti-sigma-F factor Fin family protein [Metabacillus kandeliae]MCD7036648.1 anti-sigma-F factor Fin family protein [Metabacillus kandeliae]
MALHYVCRHCSFKIGTIDKDIIESSRLGFQLLSNTERQEMLTTLENGDMIVKTICEDCQEALDRNPAFHEADTFIH